MRYSHMATRMHRPRVTARLKNADLWKRLSLLERSQNWLAPEIGVTPGYLFTLVNGQRHPSARARRRMQEILGVRDFDEIFVVDTADDGT